MNRYRLACLMIPLVAGGWHAAPAAEDAGYTMIGKDARWHEPRSNLPDLSVQYISRLPRFPGMKVTYTDLDDPILGKGPTSPVIENEGAQGWPRPGEQVEFIAVVRNVGSLPVDGFDWHWLYDGREIRSGRRAEPLAADEALEFRISRPWEDGPHAVAFEVDRDRLVEEISEENNWVVDRTDALSFAFFVEQSVAEYFQTVRSGLGSYSFEDWAQFQVRQMNKEFRDTIYPGCPDGIVERVRLDRVYRIPDGWGSKGGMHTPNVAVPVDVNDPVLVNANDPPADRESANFNNVIGGVDGVWGFTIDLLTPREDRGGKHFYEYAHRWLTGSEWPLHHELGHQLGRADHYLVPTARDANEAIPGLAYSPPRDYRDGMMFSGNYAHDNKIGKNTEKWDSTYRFYSEHTARRSTATRASDAVSSAPTCATFPARTPSASSTRQGVPLPSPRSNSSSRKDAGTPTRGSTPNRTSPARRTTKGASRSTAARGSTSSRGRTTPC